MKEKKKIKLELKEEIILKMYREHPENFEKVEKIVKVSLHLQFTKMITAYANVYKTIYKEGGLAVSGYMNILMRFLDYKNRIDFDDMIKEQYLTKRNIDNTLKPKLKKLGIIKKMGSYYYLNPLIAYKGKVVNPELIELFKEENKTLYGVKI